MKHLERFLSRRDAVLGTVENRHRRSRHVADDKKYLSAQVLKLQEALKMLYDLLEDYAPPWYTKEHHDKAEAALPAVKNDISEK